MVLLACIALVLGFAGLLWLDFEIEIRATHHNDLEEDSQ